MPPLVIRAAGDVNPVIVIVGYPLRHAAHAQLCRRHSPPMIESLMFSISAVCPCTHLLMHRCSNSNRRTIGTLSITITVISNHCSRCLGSRKVLITSVHSAASIEYCLTGHASSCPFSLPPSFPLPAPRLL